MRYLRLHRGGKRSHHRLLGVTLLLALGGVFFIPLAQAQSLKEALALAYETNPDLRAGQADFEASQEQIALARSQGRLQAGGSLSYEYQDGNYDPGNLDLGGAGIGDLGPIIGALTGNAGVGTTATGIQIVQPLFQGFRVKNAILGAKAAVGASRSNLQTTEQQILAEAIASYFAIISAEQTLMAANLSVESLQAQQRAAQIAFEIGQNSTTDTARIDAGLARAEAARINGQANLAVARAQFERIIGQPPASLEKHPPLPPLSFDQAGFIDLALSHNPQLKAARRLEEAAWLEVKIAEGARGPSLSAKATYGYARDSFIQGDQSTSGTLSAELTIPLYQGGAEFAAIRQAKAKARAAHQRVLSGERQVREAAIQAWLRHEAAEAAVLAAERGLRAASMAYASASEENRLGVISSLDVLVAEEALFNARVSLVNARQQQQLTAYGLLQVAGKLTARDLGLDVAFYDKSDRR